MHNLAFPFVLIIIALTIYQSESFSEEQELVFTQSSSPQTIVGYFNIAHGHLEDGTPIAEFYLFDFINFRNPPIFLVFSEDISVTAKKWLEYSGNTIAVVGTIAPNQGDFPRFDSASVVLNVQSIIPPDDPKLKELIERQREFTFTPRGLIALTSYNDESKTNNLFYEERSTSITQATHERTNPTGPAISGVWRSLTVPLKFSDFSTVEPHTRNYYFTKFYDQSSDSLVNYLEHASFGKFSLTGTVLDWQTLPSSRAFYAGSGELSRHNLVTGAVSTIDPAVNFNNFDQIIYIVNTELPDPSNPGATNPTAFAYLHPMASVTAEGVVYLYESFYTDDGTSFPVNGNYQKGYGVVAHEVGHNFHWYHTPLLKPYDVYSDPWSVMSGWNDLTAPPGVIAYHKMKANWIEQSDVVPISVGQRKTIELNFLNEASPDVNKFLMGVIPFGIQGEFYTVEARKDSQYDHIPHPIGVMIYHYKPSGYGFDVFRQNNLDEHAPVTAVMADPRCLTLFQGTCVRHDLNDIDLDAGKTYTDVANNISITFDSQSTQSVTLTINNNAQNSVPSAPLSLTSLAKSPTEIELNWNLPTDNGGSQITGYKIERESPVGGGFSVIVPNTLNTSTTFRDTGLSPNTTYNYRVSAINSVGTGPASNIASSTTTVPGSFDVSLSSTPFKIPERGSGTTSIVITPTGGFIGIVDLRAVPLSNEIVIQNLNPDPVTIAGTNSVTSSLTVESVGPKGNYSIEVSAISGSISKSKIQQVEVNGCLIATATYGSDLAPQVQMLRETRDNVLLTTTSGQVFMNSFNTFYYTFSPTIATWEAQNPIFKEAVKVAITPLISTLSILTIIDIDSEAKMLGYGIGIILLNIGMYFVAPTVIVYKIKNRQK